MAKYFMVCLAAASILACGPGYAEVQNAVVDSDTCLKEVGFYSGYGAAEVGHGDDNEKVRDYDNVYIAGRFGFNLKKWLSWKMPGMFLFMVEPFANPVIRPGSNYEAGLSLGLKYAFPVTSKLYPYIEGGTGGIYISEKTRRQGSHANFVDHAGAGIYYFIKDNIALNAGYRFRHISNLGIKRPNGGIETNSVTAGVSLFY